MHTLEDFRTAMQWSWDTQAHLEPHELVLALVRGLVHTLAEEVVHNLDASRTVALGIQEADCRRFEDFFALTGVGILAVKQSFSR